MSSKLNIYVIFVLYMLEFITVGNGTNVVVCGKVREATNSFLHRETYTTIIYTSTHRDTWKNKQVLGEPSNSLYYMDKTNFISLLHSHIYMCVCHTVTSWLQFLTTWSIESNYLFDQILYLTYTFDMIGRYAILVDMEN
jgi:hypothetical protein